MRRFVAVLAFLAACTAPLPRAAKPAQAKEQATLWKICYGPDGSPSYTELWSEKPACSNWEVIRWPSLPVPVYVANDVASGPVLAAFEAWEGWMGTPVFKMVPSPGPGVVSIEHGLDEIGEILGAAAIAPHRKNKDGTLTHWVFFFGDYGENPAVVAHELGHVLGLAHDHHDKRSIMYPSQKWYLQRLQAVDKQALCRFYGC